MKNMAVPDRLAWTPAGWVSERQVRRVHLSHHAKQLLYLTAFVALVILGSFDGWS